MYSQTEANNYSYKTYYVLHAVCVWVSWALLDDDTGNKEYKDTVPMCYVC